MSSLTRVVVLLSGRGSNLQSLCRNAHAYQVVGVASNVPEAVGLEVARSFDVPTLALPRAGFATVHEQKAAIFAALERWEPDLLVLAGYMQIVPRAVIEQWWGKMLNIHPSLLPELPGLDTHARAIAEGKRWHGCSVHLVDAGIDTGPVIAQARVAVQRSDTPATLAARVLTREHKLYPWVVNAWSRGAISVDARRIQYSDEARIEAQALDFIIPTDHAPSSV